MTTPVDLEAFIDYLNACDQDSPAFQRLKEAVETFAAALVALQPRLDGLTQLLKQHAAENDTDEALELRALFERQTIEMQWEEHRRRFRQ